MSNRNVAHWGSTSSGSSKGSFLIAFVVVIAMIIAGAYKLAHDEKQIDDLKAQLQTCQGR